MCTGCRRHLLTIILFTEKVFTTSCERISDLSVDFLKEGLSIQFMGEAGMGSGVRREWFENLSREILNPDYALFTQSADGKNMGIVISYLYLLPRGKLDNF